VAVGVVALVAAELVEVAKAVEGRAAVRAEEEWGATAAQTHRRCQHTRGTHLA
jgi:hypothetical protein